MDTANEEVQAMLKLLHDNERGGIDRKHAIILMAIRYGQARALQAGLRGSASHAVWAVCERARTRRFAALQRLVYSTS